jgi:hypothetical protein
MRRVILLPNGHRCTLGTYVAAWRTLRALPAGMEVKGWLHFPEPAGAILRDLRAGMHDRINRHDPSYGTGRKWSTEWQINARRDARIVNEYASKRIVHPVNRLSTPELQARFGWSCRAGEGVDVRLYSRRAA